LNPTATWVAAEVRGGERGLNMKGIWVAHHWEVDRMRDEDRSAKEGIALRVKEERRRSFSHYVLALGTYSILDLDHRFFYFFRILKEISVRTLNYSVFT
jgi:hypothetical protein